MSYKRAWQFVETMNAMFQEPLVRRIRGGAKGGGTQVTEAGEVVMTEFRTLEAEARRAGEPHVTWLRAMLNDIPERK
ncbi:winged helix-turn-helix domain-containing protein [Jannaschia seosinensis]|nr:ModE family transcriptional regulator [Jannaschia seosinensis]